ncbi:BCS1 N terminal-domain-containing protein [Aspergillus pseudocaelatus]|uniref:BCS1 N terminal-domain-containing protein n=1 Tax=Aspergillus pseudocaelatus TaxID=1825620 RepID=A0ABQ6WKW7_9EURO|nr:BCS1 N terminal-domain-containing protein [Aspergillus pseudocaelatus]
MESAQLSSIINKTNMNSTTPPLLSPSDTALLEAFIPGYSFISRFLISYLQIDLSLYLPYILTYIAIAAVLKYSFSKLKGVMETHCIATAEIRLDDEISNYLLYWMAQQPFANRSTRFLAATRISTQSYDYDSDDEDEWGEEDEYDEDGNVINNFDEYWAKTRNRDKFKRLRFTPAEGTHYFFFRGQLLAFVRAKGDQKPSSSSRWGARFETERLYLSCFGRDPAILKELLAEAQRMYVARDGNSTIIYRGQRSPGDYVDWSRCMARSPRPLSTVILDQAQKDAFVDDIKEYLHPRTRRWYSNRGIPYRRGYLLHGPPGTGKTSLCFAVAGLMGLPLYLLNLSSKSFSEDDLMSLFQELPRRCIVLLEDVDCAGITQKRVSDGGEDSTPKPADGKEGDAPEDADAESSKQGVSLSGLLNVIDGVAASEGRILVMTTNHPEKLDPALLRPGRVDMSIQFGYAEPGDIKELFSAIYSTLEGDVRSSRTKRPPQGKKDQVASEVPWHPFSREQIQNLADQFLALVPGGQCTAAEIQGYLLNYKRDPEAAIDGVEDWVQGIRSKREGKTEATVKSG